MQIDTNTLVSISEANQNFSKVTRLVDQFTIQQLETNKLTDQFCFHTQHSIRALQFVKKSWL